MIERTYRGPVYGVSTGIVLAIFSFIPYLEIIPVAIGTAISWVWKIILIGVLQGLQKIELYDSLSFYSSESGQFIAAIVAGVVLPMLLCSRKKWLKRLGVILSVLLVLAIAALVIIGLFLTN